MSLEMKHQWGLGPSHKDGQRLRNHTMLPELSAACDTADQEVQLDQLHGLASAERTALSWLHSFLFSRSQEAPDRQLLLLSMSLDMKNATGLNSSTTSI